MPHLNRRDLVIGALATGIASPAFARSRAEIWSFGNLERIGGHPIRIEGSPILVDSPLGAALTFDGEQDALFIDHHPLAGAERFTFEALFRPDGGAFEQRWFHLESDQTPPVAPGTGTTRMLFEIRVVEDHWYLDAFMRGDGYNQVLIVPEKRFPTGEWYHVAQTYDGTTYRSYVNGALQAEAVVAFKPQGPGKASVGIRMNKVNPFKGAIRQAAFVKGAARRPGGFVLELP